ncbi:hypothetical protein CBR_g31176 [Chara braunii]|uniref:Integrase catalytic domain-containing protein n=1 Tax=Chara braunii TaxID=69332 RepID=A0A388LEI2_CHABU|nr:hypothetical protein CBR_g31176 [Chara braunii]|eukprot:GBG80720.1 hypothetical protein CBR_g31176 [Chara braunii]
MAIQRQLAEAKAAHHQAAIEVAAAAQLQQQQTKASQNKVRYQATTELANEEATYRRVFRQQHFHANEEQEELTEEKRSKEAIAVLMENVLYTCNWQQRELLAMRQIFVRYETTFQTLEQKITALQTANSDQQAINNQLQTTVSTRLARLSGVESTGSAVAGCSPALAGQAKQLEARINHVVTSLGDISKLVGTSTISNQLQMLSDRVQQRTATIVKEWKMPNFKIEKFDDYHKTDPLQCYLTKIDREHATQRYVDIDAPLLYIRIQIGKATCILDRPIHHGITLEDGVVPRRGCIYRMSEEELQVLRAQLDDLLAKGWIRPSCSPYGAPVLFVRKKNKDLRLCIDYRKLNEQTIKNADPLPQINDLLERLGSAKYFSKLDLKSEYHQIEIQPRDRYKTAFKTRYGHFEWLVMPFSLTNTPTTFRAAMTTEFRDLLDCTVVIYLDDILVYSWSLDELLEHLRVVLERLRIAKYKANRHKCEFAQQELEYLGHYVTPQGTRPLADKVQAIQDWPDLACTTDVRSFLGLASYYMRFVKSFQRVAAPLSRLQSPLVPFEFNDEARQAFHTLKTTLLQAPVLSIYDPTLPTKVTTDASGYGIGPVLEQHDDTDWHPVECFSQKVSPINSLDDARKKELLAFVTILERWHHFLLGRLRFTWATDNNPLTYYKMQDTVSSTIGSWMYFIDQFNFTSKHIPGPSNKAVDALSRRPDLCTLVHSTFGLDEDLQQHFVNGYKSDPGFSTLYANLSSDHPPTSNYRIVDGYLLLHTRGKDLLCLSIAMDVTGPFPRDRLGHDGILTVVDRLSKYVRFLPCKYHATAPKLARLLHTGWFCSHDVPEDIVNNRDTRFMSAFWTALMVESGTSMKPSSVRHPQTDGQTERAHQTAQMMLRTLIHPDQKDSVDRLLDIEFAYNTSVHLTIGVTPFELHHDGRKGRIFADILLPRAADIDATCSPASTQKPGESLSMDFMDTLVTSKSGMRHIFVIVDRFSKYARLVAVSETVKTEHVIRLFKENWVRDFGLPKSIVSDRDVRFTSELWKAAAAEQGTQLQMTYGNHPEANGQAEQLNRAVQHLLRHYIKPNQVNWDEKLALIASLYNNAVHNATGVSPNSLLLTFKPRLPLDFLLPDNQSAAAPGTLEFAYRYEQLMQKAVEQMHKAQAAMIETENKHHCPSTFQVGDRVWVKSSELGQEHRISRKLMPQYFGPWEVLDVVGEDPDGPSYVIRIPGHLRTYPVFHASKLAPLRETDQFPSRRSMLPPTMDGEVDIDSIVDHREMPVPRPIGRGRPRKPKLQYRVQFRHHTDPKEDRWFTREELMQTAPQWYPNWGLPYAVRNKVMMASTIARSTARQCYRVFVQRWPDRGRRLFSLFDGSTQKLLTEDESVTSSKVASLSPSHDLKGFGFRHAVSAGTAQLSTSNQNVNVPSSHGSVSAPAGQPGQGLSLLTAQQATGGGGTGSGPGNGAVNGGSEGNGYQPKPSRVPVVAPPSPTRAAAAPAPGYVSLYARRACERFPQKVGGGKVVGEKVGVLESENLSTEEPGNSCERPLPCRASASSGLGAVAKMPLEGLKPSRLEINRGDLTGGLVLAIPSTQGPSNGPSNQNSPQTSASSASSTGAAPQRTGATLEGARRVLMSQSPVHGLVRDSVLGADGIGLDGNIKHSGNAVSTEVSFPAAAPMVSSRRAMAADRNTPSGRYAEGIDHAAEETAVHTSSVSDGITGVAPRQGRRAMVGSGSVGGGLVPLNSMCGRGGGSSYYAMHDDDERSVESTKSSDDDSLGTVGSSLMPTSRAHNVQTGGGGWLGKRVYTLEEKAKIYEKHEADEAKERAACEEAERKKREKDEEDRRLREKQDRDEFQRQMRLELTESLDKVLRGDVASTSVAARSSEGKELARLRREQAETKAAAEKRLSALEEVVLALQRQCEEAEENAERWKSEALRPGNKRGCITVGPTPSSQARFLLRTTAGETPKRHVEIDLKGIVERHQMEVEALQKLRISEMNARKESEEEVERLKELLAKLDMEKKTVVRGTNLKSKLDEVAAKEKVVENEAGPSTRKGKEKAVPGSASKSVDRDAFVCANRRDLRGKNKEAIMGICEKEGVTYTTLEPTKEAIVHVRAARASDEPGGKNDKACGDDLPGLPEAIAGAYLGTADWSSRVTAFVTLRKALQNGQRGVSEVLANFEKREREAEAAARATSIAEQVALLTVPKSNDDRFRERIAAAVAALVRLRTLEDLESCVTALKQRNQELQAEILSLKQSQLSAPRPPNLRPAAVPVSQPNTVLMTRASGTVTSAGTGASSSSGSADSFALVIVPNAGTSAQNATVLTGVQYSGPVVDKWAATLPSKYDGKGDITSWISAMRSYFEVLRTRQEDRSMVMGTNTEPVVRSFIELQAVTAGYDRIDLTEWLKVTPVCTLEDLLITQYQDKHAALKARLKLEALKDQTWRTSMQALEQHLTSLKNVYPLPRIDDLLDAAGGCKVFSKLDLKTGYHQIEVDPSDQHKTAFKTRDGLYEFIVMPFGLTNAPATFQCLMDKVLRHQLNRFVVVYLDDILIFSKSMEEHAKHLEEVLQVLKEAQLHLNLEKSEFGRDSVIYQV